MILNKLIDYSKTFFELQKLHSYFTDKLEDYQHLRGGVIFLDELPKTSTGKEARAKNTRDSSCFTKTMSLITRI